jgi:hypothetical protein
MLWLLLPGCFQHRQVALILHLMNICTSRKSMRTIKSRHQINGQETYFRSPPHRDFTTSSHLKPKRIYCVLPPMSSLANLTLFRFSSAASLVTVFVRCPPPGDQILLFHTLDRGRWQSSPILRQSHLTALLHLSVLPHAVHSICCPVRLPTIQLAPCRALRVYLE